MRNTLVILGMHRSGTSAATGVLALLGGDIGTTVMDTNPMNPKGFFENQRLRLLNDEILSAFGAAWDNPFGLPEGWEQADRLAPLRDSARDALAEEFQPGGLRLVKDPRLCVLLPFWQPLMEASGLDPGYIVVIRHPLEAADSLTANYGFPRAKGIYLWLRHMLSAEVHTRGRARVFVDFNDLLGRPRRYQRRVSSGLGVTWPRPWDQAEGSVADFLDPALKHHNRRHQRGEPHFLAAVSAVHGILHRLAVSPAGEDMPADMAALDEWRRQFYAGLQLFHSPQILEGTERRPADHRPENRAQGGGFCESGVRALEGEVAALRQNLSRWEALSEELTQALEGSRKELARTAAVLDEVTSSKAWRLAQCYRKLVYGPVDRESDGGSG